MSGHYLGTSKAVKFSCLPSWKCSVSHYLHLSHFLFSPPPRGVVGRGWAGGLK
jgi:hypothetical protein